MSRAWHWCWCWCWVRVCPGRTGHYYCRTAHVPGRPGSGPASDTPPPPATTLPPPTTQPWQVAIHRTMAIVWPLWGARSCRSRRRSLEPGDCVPCPCSVQHSCARPSRRPAPPLSVPQAGLQLSSDKIICSTNMSIYRQYITLTTLVLSEVSHTDTLTPYRLPWWDWKILALDGFWHTVEWMPAT